MGFFDDLGKKVSDAGQKTLQKTKEMSDTAKINSMISEEERKLNNTYYQIGKLYVSVHGGDGEEEFVGMLSSIAESESKIREYRKQIQDIKGVQICETCGAEVQRGVAFCGSCGSPMPRIQPVNMEDVVRCSNCGNTVKKGMRFCTECGSPMAQPVVPIMPDVNIIEPEKSERFCSNCGTKVNDDAVFCIECGAKL